MDDIGGFFDDLDPLGSSIKMRAELLGEVLGSPKKKKSSNTGSFSESMRPDIPSFSAFGAEDANSPQETPIRITKKRSRVSPGRIEPLDDMTLGIRAKGKSKCADKQPNKRKRNQKKKDDFDDMAMEDNRLEEEMENDLITNALAGRPPARSGRGRDPIIPIIRRSFPVPLRAIRPTYNEYGNEDIPSSCDELSDSDMEQEIKKKRQKIKEVKKQPMSESDKIMEIIRNKGLDKMLDEKKEEQKKPTCCNQDVAQDEDSDCPSLSSRSDSPQDEMSDAASWDYSPINRRRKRDEYEEVFACIKKFNGLNESGLRRSKICFGCMWSNKDEGMIEATPFNSMMDLIKQNVGSIALRWLAKLVHYYYKIHIREPMMADGYWLPMWRTADIYDHLLRHNHDPIIWQDSSMTKYKKISNILEDLLLRVEQEECGENISDRLVFDIRYHKALIENDKVIAGLYKMNPKEHVFYSENYRVEPNGVGRLVNIHKNFYFSKNTK
jgi:hypothetical protein